MYINHDKGKNNFVGLEYIFISRKFTNSHVAASFFGGIDKYPVEDSLVSIISIYVIHTCKCHVKNYQY